MRTALFLLGTALLAQQAPAPCLDRPEADRPYSRERLLTVVRDQTPARAEYLIRTCGVRTPWTEELAEALKEAGAEDSVVAAIREKAPAPPAPKPPPGPAPGQVKQNPKDGLAYAWIPAGVFTMGCADNHPDCFSSEKPAHRVRITKGFWMGQTEVTVGAYQRYVQATGGSMPEEPSHNPGWRARDLPMNRVTWFEARDYCQWAGVRLPTEAEWEYAARAGTTGQVYGELDAVAWYSANSGSTPRPVGQKRANAWNLHDLLGNLWEWVGDWYAAGEYQSRGNEVADPAGPASGERRSLRGGSWINNPRLVRLSDRFFNAPADRYSFIGFRCVGELPFP